MNKKIIAAGHTCLDIAPVFHTKERYRRIGDLLEPGKLIQMDEAKIHTGGSVPNTGLALKLLGNEVQLLGKIGKDAFGRMIQDIFASYGAGGLIVDETVSTSYSVVIAVPGIDRIFLHNPGANDSFCAADIPDSALADAVLFHFGYPTLMKRMYEDEGAELVRLFERVKAWKIATSLDLTAVDPSGEAARADWKGILEKVLPFVDFFVPSFEELCFMLNRPLYDRLAAEGSDMTENLNLEAFAMPLAEKCVDMGCAVALIKCGTSGMVYKTAGWERLAKTGSRLQLDYPSWMDRKGIQPCFPAEIVRSAAGAGDVSIAAYLTAVLCGKSPAHCASLAAAEGACAVASYDALSGIRPLEELEERIAAGWSAGDACQD